MKKFLAFWRNPEKIVVESVMDRRTAIGRFMAAFFGLWLYGISMAVCMMIDLPIYLAEYFSGGIISCFIGVFSLIYYLAYILVSFAFFVVVWPFACLVLAFVIAVDNMKNTS